MDSKPVRWIVLVISIVLIIGAVSIIIRDITFFSTKREGLAKILAIDKSSSGYKIRLSYFNDYKKKSVEAIVKFKQSYKKEIGNFSDTVIVYYSKILPRHVYIKELNVPKKGIVILEIIFLLLLCLAAMFGFDGIHNR